MAIPDFLSTYDNVLQAQLITAKGKPRTWFGTQDGQQYVIKGPLPEKERRECMTTQRLKEVLGVPHTYMREEGEFMVQRCIRDYTTLPTVVQSSRWEKGIRVPVFGAWEWKDEYVADASDTAVAQSMLEALLFRKIAGTNDTCSHNFIVDGCTVYSIDDRALGKRTRFMWKKALVDPVLWQDLQKAHWPALLATMERWLLCLPEEAVFARKVLKTMKNPAKWRW